MQCPGLRYVTAAIAGLLFLPVSVNAAITKVVLFPGQATVTLEESRSVAAGEGQITIDNLPAGLEDNSLRVTLTGGDKVTLGQTTVRLEQRTAVISDRVRDLQEQLTAVNDKIRELDDTVRAAQYRLDLLKGLTENPGKSFPVSDIDSAATSIQAQAADALTIIRNTGKSKRSQQSEKSRLQREMAQIRQGAKAVKHLSIAYNSQEAATLKVKVSYQTRQAGWSSHYEARLNTRNDTLNLNHMAVIHQSTGEDWKNIALWLSTSDVDAGGKLPHPSTWYVAPRPKPQPRTAQSFEAEADMAELKMAKGAPAQPAPVRLEQNGLSQRYRIPGKVSISDGTRQQRLQVAGHTLQADVSTHMVPALSPRGFIHASAEYEGNATLPAAGVTLYQDNQYTGDSRLEQTQPGEPVKMAFGVDDRINIKVARDIDKKGEKGLINGEKYLKRLNRYEITNNHKGKVRVHVVDRLPVSRNDDITVTPQSITQPVQNDVDDKKGIIAWDRTIDPGSTLALTAGFELRVPDDQELPLLGGRH